MANTIWDFIRDIDNGLVSLENFNQGIFNFYKQVVEGPTPPHALDERQLAGRQREERQVLEAHPELFGAVCFHALTKHLGMMKETKFYYEISPGENTTIINSTLLSGLRGVAFAIGKLDDGPHSSFSGDWYEDKECAINDFVTGAFYSARSLQRLEPLQELTPMIATQEEEDEDPDENWMNWSLGDMIQSEFGHELKEDARSGFYKRVMERWFFLLRDDSFERLKPHLSLEQANTARMLLEWWHGSTDFEAATEQSRDAVRQIVLSDNLPGNFLQCAGYQKSMRSLFFEEFVDGCDLAEGLTSRLEYRRALSKAAAAQRLAIAVYRSLVDAHDIDLQSQQPPEISMGRHTAEYDRNIGATLSPCAWLPEDEGDNDMPYYLWDVRQRRSVVSGDLKGRVEYTAVSHTWGRWKTQGGLSVQVEGVDRWLIPQNTKFDVADLPNILESACFETSFVWFDLLCIPQEPESNRLKFVARDEIARQAKIFRRAKHAVAWLNDVYGWTGLHVALRRLAINYLQEDNELPPWLLHLDDRNNDVELELASDRAHAESGEMNGWFTSLWTLQELCLRPDMTLFDHQWHPFAIGGARDTAVRLDDLVALWGVEGVVKPDMRLGLALSDASELWNKDLKSTSALDYLFRYSGFADFPNPSRKTILTLGNQRYCTANRAEAIMSAIGVTDWYSAADGNYDNAQSAPSASPSQQQPSNDRYPLGFLREAVLKLGPDFYAASFQAGEIRTSLFQSHCLSSGSPEQGPGTMLPFGTGPFAKGQSLSSGLPGTAHPSVKTWTIQADLSVDIRQAGIISYTGQVHSAENPILAFMIAPFPETRLSLEVEFRNDVDLDDWVESYYPQTRNFAVCLQYGPWTHGVLLKEIVTGDLIKVGIFAINDFEDQFAAPPTTWEVGWRVL
ncbi:hypothetical protein BDW59DRAFT_178227 [Aspergillus cavernicola]|uniref:Heterokaryon incompatibility domain-containing protein n=1 Tax=Aspergillus cavernicola TaxID=176166 RepID=A0ABR4HDC6_9EURO